MLRLIKYLRPADWALMLVSAAFIVMQVWLELTMPDYMGKITELIVVDGAMNEVLYNGGIMLACAAGSLVAAIITSYMIAKLSANFSARLRGELFFRVESFSMAEVNRFSTPSLITRTTNDVTQVQMLVSMGLQMLIKSPIMAIWALVKIVDKSWQWSVTTAVGVVFILLMISVIMFFAMPKFKRIQKLTDNLNRITRENLTGIRVVRAYNAESYQEERFEVANQEMTKNQMSANRAMAVMSPGMTLLMNGLTLAIYAIGAYLIMNAEAAQKIVLIRDMTIFSQYAMQIIMSFMMLAMIFIMMPRATVSAKRIFEVLDTKPTIVDPENPVKHDAAFDRALAARGEVEFKNVSFKYPDAEEYVLENISFKAGRGETIAFIGSTGSGKSTLINLIPRFYDVTGGEILVDGVDVRNYALKDLNNKIGYISQKGVMFSGTIESNVNFGESGKEITQEDISKAVSVAQASEFVDKLEDGYSHHVAQGGTNLSGGQKQRLSIARAICKDPEILIFDDSFSALDYKTDRSLRGALRTEAKQTTNLIVAQRIGTIKDADKIIVLDNGRMVGYGRHEDLLKDCSVYKEIALSQLSEEELKA